MFHCDCRSETLCVTRVVLRCGDDGHAEHLIEVADGSCRRSMLDWRVVRIVVVGEFHFREPSLVHAEVACARCGAAAPEPIRAPLLELAGDLADDAAGALMVLQHPHVPPKEVFAGRSDRAVA